MKSVAELEKELDQARKLETEAQEKTKLEQFRELEGKCFQIGWKWNKGESIGIARYSKFRLEHKRVYYTIETVILSLPVSGKTGAYDEPVGITRTCNPYSNSEQLFDITRNHIKPVSKSDFDRLWEVPIKLARAQLDLFKNLPEPDNILYLDDK